MATQMMKMAKIKVEGTLGPWLILDPAELSVLADYGEVGDAFVVTFVSMSESEVAQLPEFDGF